MAQVEKYILQLDKKSYLKSFTLNETGGMGTITITPNSLDATEYSKERVMEIHDTYFPNASIYKAGTWIIHIPSHDEYERMYESRLSKSTDDKLLNEVRNRLISSIKPVEVRNKLGYCFGQFMYIHYTDDKKEMDIQTVYEKLKYGGESIINGLTQYQNFYHNDYETKVEVIELDTRGSKEHLYIKKRYIIDFPYNSPLEMVTDKTRKFPTTDYYAGCIVEDVSFGTDEDNYTMRDGDLVSDRLESFKRFVR